MRYGEDAAVPNQAEAIQVSREGWAATATPDYLKQKLQEVYAQELVELGIDLSVIDDADELSQIKDRLVERRREKKR